VTDLIGDIGGTNARFALVENGSVYESENLMGADYPSFQAAIEAYLKMLGNPRIRTAAFAFAGPVTGDQVKLTNRPDWAFSTESLRQACKFGRLFVVNDFYANALSLPALLPSDLLQIGSGQPLPNHTKVVLGPGSGLGVAIVAWDGADWLPLPGEGGHARLPMGANPREDALFIHLREKFGTVTIEHLLSGSGLAALYAALCQVDGNPQMVPEQHQITTAALQGSDAYAVETLSLFLSILGTAAGNLALTTMARGGVYIAGGIVPACVSLVDRSPFRESFLGASKMRPLLEPIPTYVITNEHPAFVGLVRLLSQQPPVRAVG
jgi:glucokinase